MTEYKFVYLTLIALFYGDSQSRKTPTRNLTNKIETNAYNHSSSLVHRLQVQIHFPPSRAEQLSVWLEFHGDQCSLRRTHSEASEHSGDAQTGLHHCESHTNTVPRSFTERCPCIRMACSNVLLCKSFRVEFFGVRVNGGIPMESENRNKDGRALL